MQPDPTGKPDDRLSYTTPRDTISGRGDRRRYVVALGSHSPSPLPRSASICPSVNGYSLSVPITDPDGASQSTVMDEYHKVAPTLLGDRIRVGGMAELDFHDARLHPRRRATLEHVVGDFHGGDAARGTLWAGHRPMTPDGPSVIGLAKFDNLWLNTGHRTLGWTVACGSGRVLADLMSGLPPEIDARPVAIRRCARSS